MSTVSTILLSARDAGDFSDAAGEREMAPKCGSLPRDAGDLVGLTHTHMGLKAVTSMSSIRKNLIWSRRHVLMISYVDLVLF